MHPEIPARVPELPPAFSALRRVAPIRPAYARDPPENDPWPAASLAKAPATAGSSGNLREPGKTPPIQERDPAVFPLPAACPEFPRRLFPAAAVQNSPRQAWAKASRCAFPEEYFRQLQWTSRILPFPDIASPARDWRERHARRSWLRLGRRSGLIRISLPQDRRLQD